MSAEWNHAFIVHFTANIVCLVRGKRTKELLHIGWAVVLGIEFHFDISTVCFLFIRRDYVGILESFTPIS